MPTIVEATKGKTLPANGEIPERQVWTLKLDDGREAEIVRRSSQPEPPSGAVTVEEGQYGLKAKLANAGGKGGGRAASPQELRGKNMGVAISYAKDLVIADKIEVGQISAYAEKIYDLIESKAKVGE